MQIPLNQFEQFIDETILKRGLSYFNNGFVNEPEEVTPNVYEAIVTGTEDYTVELKIQNDTIVEHVCTCPYDMGPVCKHVVAVLFYMQQEVLEIKPKNLKQPQLKIKATPKKNNKKTITEQVNEVLEKISHDELKQFIREKTEHNPPLRNIFLSSFAHQNTNESKDTYIKQVKSILRTASGRDGFIDWNQTRGVGKAIDELLDAAQKQFANKNYKSAIFICTAVMEELIGALQYTDDSNGDIGGNIDFAYGLLYDFVKEKLPEEIRKFLFEYCLSTYEKGIFSGWDWHFGLMHLADELLINEDEAEQIITLLDKIQDSEYDREVAQSIKLNIIKKTKGEKEAEKFIEQNLTNPSIRREALAKALKNKEYEKAIVIANDGIKQDEKNKPGLVKDWYNWLLKIAQAQQDKAKIIEFARLLFIDNFSNEQNYYQLLKNNIETKNWNNFVEEIVKDIELKKRWLDIELIAKIYIKEEWWDRLLELVIKNPTLSYIEQYEKHLSTDFSNELIQLYTASVVNYVKNNTGRNHYQTACRYLRRMIKLGGRKDVEKIILDFRTQYPQRRALIEELNLV